MHLSRSVRERVLLSAHLTSNWRSSGRQGNASLKAAAPSGNRSSPLRDGTNHGQRIVTSSEPKAISGLQRAPLELQGQCNSQPISLSRFSYLLGSPRHVASVFVSVRARAYVRVRACAVCAQITTSAKKT